MTRPEYVHCVRRSHVDMQNYSWCGRQLFTTEWTFVDASHAAENGWAMGRLVACPECVKAITTALRNGSEP